MAQSDTGQMSEKDFLDYLMRKCTYDNSQSRGSVLYGIYEAIIERKALLK